MKLMILTGLSITLTTVFVVGCGGDNYSSSSKTNSATLSSVNTANSQNLKQAISMDIHKQLGNITNLTVTYSKMLGSSYLSQILFTSDSKDYEGAVYASKVNGKWKIDQKTFTPIDRSVAVTHMEFSGTTNDGKYGLLSGVVNNDQINRVVLHYISGNIIEVFVSPATHTYAYAPTSSQGPVMSITGIGPKNAVIYQSR